MAWNYQHHLPERALGAIPFLFESGNVAHSLATGAGFSSPFRVDTGPTAWMTPVYPLLLAGMMRLFGVYTYHSFLAAVGLNILASTLVCVPLFYAGKRIGGMALAALAAWLWAVFPNAVLMTYQSLWDQSVAALLGAAIFWATLKVAESRTRRAWAAYGLLWGATLMTTPTFLSLAPFLLAWMIYRARRRAWPWLANAALAAGLAALCCVPWTVRNYEVFHSLVPLRSILGLQLWVGNNPQAKVIWLGDQHPIHDSAERQKYIQMGEMAYMRDKERNAVRYILTHPRHEAELIGGRFVSLWAGGTPIPVRDFFRNGSAWFRYVLLFNVCLFAGMVAGIVILYRARSTYALPAAVFPLVFPWAYYLTLSMPRYRHPIDPVLILLMAIALLHWFGPRKKAAKIR